MRVVLAVSMGVIGVASLFFMVNRAESQPVAARFGLPPIIHAELGSSTDVSLRRLSEHEVQLGRGVDSAMVFRDMPSTAEAAREQAVELAGVLHEYARSGVSPLVVFEPQGLDLRYIDTGVFEVYFDTLRSEAITDSTIGTWIPFPEPNIPEWHDGRTDSRLFVSNMTAFARIFKERFGSASVVVLLDSKTYPSGDTYWANGTYDTRKLLKYVDGFPQGLIDTVGLQGLMWESKAGEDGDKVYDASVFLPAKSAIAAARKLGVHKVLLNTGTYASMYDWVPQGGVAVGTAERAKTLATIIDQATLVQQAGLLTTITLFAEDKRHAEADWSYGQSEASWKVLHDFASEVSEKGIGLGLFVGSE